MYKETNFKTGQKIKSIFFTNGDELNISSPDVKSITVIMENGQMAGVPWASVIFQDDQEFKYNLALCEGVKIV